MSKKEVITVTESKDDEFHYITYVDFSLTAIKMKIEDLKSIGYEVIGNGIFSYGENCGYYKVELKKRIKPLEKPKGKSICPSIFDTDVWLYPVYIICFIAGMLFAYWVLN